jgi:hypothetical protein
MVALALTLVWLTSTPSFRGKDESSVASRAPTGTAAAANVVTTSVATTSAAAAVTAPVPAATAAAATSTTNPAAPVPTSNKSSSNSTRLPWAEPAPEASDAIVKYPNPFDPTEIFEFPPGTNRTDARQAVADLLLQRARERQALPASNPRRRTKVLVRETKPAADLTGSTASEDR